MSTSWSRRRSQIDGSALVKPAEIRFALGSVMPTASDGRSVGRSSATGFGVGVGVGGGRPAGLLVATDRQHDDHGPDGEAHQGHGDATDRHAPSLGGVRWPEAG